MSPFRVPYGNVLRYVAGGAGMAVVFMFTNEHVVIFDVGMYSYLPGLLLEMTICCATYLGIAYAIDRKARTLFRMILLEVASRRKNAGG